MTKHEQLFHFNMPLFLLQREPNEGGNWPPEKDRHFAVCRMGEWKCLAVFTDRDLAERLQNETNFSGQVQEFVTDESMRSVVERMVDKNSITHIAIDPTRTKNGLLTIPAEEFLSQL